MTIKEYCKENHISQSQLASMLGISDSYISKVFYKQIRPSKRIKDSLGELGIDIIAEDVSAYKTKKNLTIQKLQQEIVELKKENKILRDKILVKINDTLDKLVNKK